MRSISVSLSALLIALIALPTHAQPAGAPPSSEASEAAADPAALLAEPPLGLAPLTVPDTTALEDAVRDQLDEAVANVASAVGTLEGAALGIANAYGALGLHYQAYELYEPAATAYANALALAPNDPHWVFYLAEVRRQQGDLDGAAEAFGSLVEAQPNDLGALVRLGELALARNQLDDAQRYFEAAITLAPNTAAAHAGLGQTALARGDAAEAVERLTAVLEQVPEATRLHHPLGLAYRQLGDLDKARHHLAARGDVGLKVDDPRLAALANVATGERVYLLRGRRAFAAQRYAEAAEAFRKAADADPQSDRARVNLGTALGQAGDVEGAIAAYREALAIKPNNGTAHFNLGQLLAADDPTTAVGHLQQAVAVQPADPVIREALARLLRAMGRFDEAVEQAQLTISADVDREESYLTYAALLVQLQRFDEAVQTLDSANGAMPHSGLVAVALARLLAASPDISVRDGDRARTLASQVFEASPTADHAALVALAAAEQGQCDEAASWQQKVAEALAGKVPADQQQAIEARLQRYQAGPPCRP